MTIAGSDYLTLMSRECIEIISLCYSSLIIGKKFCFVACLTFWATFYRSMPTSAALDVVAQHLKLKFFEVYSCLKLVYVYLA